MIADLPELGLLCGKESAVLVGLAPHTKESGKTRYRETTGHGRAGVRRALFNAARAAIRHPSRFGDFYDRRVNQNRRPGKSLPRRRPGSRASPSCASFWSANAVARDRKPWSGADPARPTRSAVGTPGRPHGQPGAHRAGRVKAAAAPGAVARSASLEAV